MKTVTLLTDWRTSAGRQSVTSFLPISSSSSTSSSMSVGTRLINPKMSGKREGGGCNVSYSPLAQCAGPGRDVTCELTCTVCAAFPARDFLISVPVFLIECVSIQFNLVVVVRLPNRTAAMLCNANQQKKRKENYKKRMRSEIIFSFEAREFLGHDVTAVGSTLVSRVTELGRTLGLLSHSFVFTTALAAAKITLLHVISFYWKLSFWCGSRCPASNLMSHWRRASKKVKKGGKMTVLFYGYRLYSVVQ